MRKRDIVLTALASYAAYDLITKFAKTNTGQCLIAKTKHALRVSKKPDETVHYVSEEEADARALTPDDN